MHREKRGKKVKIVQSYSQMLHPLEMICLGSETRWNSPDMLASLPSLQRDKAKPPKTTDLYETE